ncbi:hypothetical protein P7K49_039849, partial [Saguinus oedipus]
MGISAFAQFPVPAPAPPSRGPAVGTPPPSRSAAQPALSSGTHRVRHRGALSPWSHALSSAVVGRVPSASCSRDPSHPLGQGPLFFPLTARKRSMLGEPQAETLPDEGQGCRFRGWWPLRRSQLGARTCRVFCHRVATPILNARVHAEVNV